MLLKGVVSLVFTAAMFAAPVKNQTTAALPVVEPVKTPQLARVIQYGPRDTVRINTRPLYTTLIVLPEKERIMQFLCGDKDFWQVSAMANMAWAKPSDQASKTDIHLLTANGNAYTFEVISDPKLEPDFKVFVEPKDDNMLAALGAKPRFVEAANLDKLNEEVDQWRAEAFRAKKEAKEREAEKVEAVEAAKVQAIAAAPAQARHEYKFAAHQNPFNVQGIWHDGKFTYIQAKPQELPALYEKRDGKPNLIQFRFDNDLYIAEKVLEKGYLQIGKKKAEFYRIPQ